MKNKNFDYKVIEQDRLAQLLELELLADELRFDSTFPSYEQTKEGIKLLGYVQKELDNYDNLSDVIEEVLDAEDFSDVSDEEKEDSLYVEEFDSCGCGCCSDDYDDDDEDEVEATYTIVYLEEDDDDEDETDSEAAFRLEYDAYWADEFDDFYSESFENSIFKEMEDFVSGKYVASTEEKQEHKDMPENAIFNSGLYQILKDYFKNILE